MSNKVELNGVSVFKVIEEQVGKNNTSKRTVVVKVDDEYSPHLPIVFIGKSYEDSSCKEGDSVNVVAYLGGREYNQKFYPDVKGYKLEVVGASQEQAKGISPNQEFDIPSEEDDDLPF